MQPHMARRIEAETRKQFPKGIPAFGVDALRFTFASQASHGRNINFDLARTEGYRNFCNKLWNAARYVLINAEGHDCGQDGGPVSLAISDQWIISRLQEAERGVRQAFADYRFDLAAQTIYSFIWDEYCSWYLELSKITLALPGLAPDAARGTRRTLVRVLETILRLLHPIMPFITETLWQRVAKLAARGGETIMLEPYPKPDETSISHTATEEITWVMAVVNAIRTVRGEMDVAPARQIDILLQGGTETDRRFAERHDASLRALARLTSITWLGPQTEAPESAISLVDSLRILIPLSGLIDKHAEAARLTKEIDKTAQDLDRSQRKLSNEDFIRRAPPSVVEEERRRVAAFELRLNELRGQLDRVLALADTA